jgi:hypothetical protein
MLLSISNFTDTFWLGAVRVADLQVTHFSTSPLLRTLPLGKDHDWHRKIPSRYIMGSCFAASQSLRCIVKFIFKKWVIRNDLPYSELRDFKFIATLKTYSSCIFFSLHFLYWKHFCLTFPPLYHSLSSPKFIFRIGRSATTVAVWVYCNSPSLRCSVLWDSLALSNSWSDSMRCELNFIPNLDIYRHIRSPLLKAFPDYASNWINIKYLSLFQG